MKIRVRKYPSGKVAYLLDAGMVTIAGKRQRYKRAFESQKEAERERDRLKKVVASQGREGLEISTEMRVRYQSAERRLREAGLTIEQAVELALKHWRPVTAEPVALGELWERFKADRQRRERDPEWVKKLGIAIGGFIAGRELKAAHEVTHEEVENWIRGNGWAPKTMRNYLGALSSMFTWAMGPRVRVVAENPCVGIELPMSPEAEPTCLDVGSCERLLTLALNGRGEAWDFRASVYRPAFVYRALLGYVALAMFGGVRPEELKRSPRSALHIEEGVIVVTAERAKPGRGRTRRRRVVELPANAVAWLKLWNELCPGDWIIPKGFRGDWKALRMAAECWPWPKDVLRHTCATMDYALHQDEARLKAKFGHSRDEDTLFEHYRAVMLSDHRPVTKAMADKFVALMPPPPETL